MLLRTSITTVTNTPGTASAIDFAERLIMKNRKTLTARSALVYALGIFGVQIFIGYMNSFQTEFYINNMRFTFGFCRKLLSVYHVAQL